MKYCIDAGHGGADSGAIGYLLGRTQQHILRESEINLAVALLVEKKLKDAGHQVIMTRRKKVSLSLSARANFANRFNADVFVSIHCNAAKARSAHGYEIFTMVGSPKSIKYAAGVLTGFMNMFPKRRNRGLKTANFSVLRRTDMPAILIELEFIHNREGAAFLANNVEKLASAITLGLT